MLRFSQRIDMAQKKRKMNPKSLANLKQTGRSKVYGEAKKGHQVSVTPAGWNGFRSIAEQLEISASELIERFGRGQLVVVIAELPIAELRERLGGEQAIILGPKSSDKENGDS